MRAITLWAWSLTFVLLILDCTAYSDEARKCTTQNAAENTELSAAGNGYNIWKSNPWKTTGDPGAENHRIFEIECSATIHSAWGSSESSGFWDFVTVTHDFNCVQKFSTETISSMEEYMNANSGSNSDEGGFSLSGSYEGFGVEFEASASFRMASSSEYAETKKFFEETQGEITIGTSTCNTYDVLISSYARPIFTPDFIIAVTQLNKAIGKSIRYQQWAYKKFVRNFGTHYSSKTQFGAKLIYERRFSSRSKTAEEEAERESCSEVEAAMSVEGGGYGVSLSAEADYKNSRCAKGSNSGGQGSGSSTESSKLITIGSRPIQGDDWSESDNFKPVPISRVLVLISELFQPDWWEVSETFGIRYEIDTFALTDLFNELSKDYCHIVKGYSREKCAEKVHGCGMDSTCGFSETCVNKPGTTKGYECVKRKVTTTAPPVVTVPPKPTSASCPGGIYTGDCYEHGIDHPGPVLAALTGITSAYSCQHECKKNSKCGFWTFNSGDRSSCWLTNTRAKAVKNANRISGPKNCAGFCYEHGVDHPASVLTQLSSIPSAYSCQQECKKNGNCRFWVYNSGDRSTCWLTRTQGKGVKNANRISGPRSCTDCYEDNTNYPADPDQIIDKLSCIATAEACQQKCQHHEKCLFWIFQKKSNTCWRKKSQGSGKKVNGMVSGYKSCLNPNQDQSMIGLFNALWVQLG